MAHKQKKGMYIYLFLLLPTILFMHVFVARLSGSSTDCIVVAHLPEWSLVDDSRGRAPAPGNSSAYASSPSPSSYPPADLRATPTHRSKRTRALSIFRPFG